MLLDEKKKKYVSKLQEILESLDFKGTFFYKEEKKLFLWTAIKLCLVIPVDLAGEIPILGETYLLDRRYAGFMERFLNETEELKFNTHFELTWGDKGPLVLVFEASVPSLQLLEDVISELKSELERLCKLYNYQDVTGRTIVFWKD